MQIYSGNGSLAFFLVCCSYAVAAYTQSTQEYHHVLTSLNSSRLMFRIPKNYPPNVPIFSIRLLRPENLFYTTDYKKSYEDLLNECNRSKRSTRSLREDVTRRGRKPRENLWNNNNGGRNLRRPNQELSKDWKDGGGSERFRNRKKEQEELRKLSRAQVKAEDKILRLNSKENKDLFRLHISLKTSIVSVSFVRNLVPEDYINLRETLIQFDIREKRQSISEECDTSYKYDQLFSVLLEVVDEFDCNELSEKMCLLPEDFLQLQHWENEPPGLVFGFPSLSKLCPNVFRNIDINMEDLNEDSPSPELQYIPSTEAIHTSKELDRELRDSPLNFSIICQLRLKKKPAIMKQFRKSYAALYIKDVDDSSPTRLKTSQVMWKITDNKDHLDDQLMIIDPDINNGKNYTIELLGNTYGLVNVESQSVFTVKKNICASETKSILPTALSAECTIITPHIAFDELYIKSYPKKVNFSLVFVDNSLAIRNRHMNNKVRYDITLILNDLNYPSVWHPQPIKPINNTLPLETNVTIHRPIQIHSRVLQMLRIFSERQFLQMSAADRVFWVSTQKSIPGLDITPVMGILYVSEPKRVHEALQKNNGKAKIIINRGLNFTASVYIELAEGIVACDQKIPKPSYITVDSPTSCAIHAYRSNCENSCGVGSLMAKCTWRNQNGSFISPHFATCSPDLDSCPDGFCDELERQHKDICPQDCVEKPMTKGQHNMHLNEEYNPPRGILSGFGVCTCNDYCQCFPADTEPTSIISRNSGEKMINRGSPQDNCGAACQVGLSIGIVVALFLIIILFCRRRKDCGGKYKDGDLNLSHYPSEFVDDHSSSYASGPVHGDAHAVALHAIHNNHVIGHRQNNCNNNNNDHDMAVDLPLVNYTIDRKWEFPRSQLVIEQTLGEGEFGKVMKGRASTLGGQPGATVVAVKMLKNNSTAAELGDLMSEYHLLKEVNHPNVIKLLGACTTKRGPIYLLIEYCKYGSLRSYLRRTRHFELECRVGSTPIELSPGDYHLTPKHLLSFAWQVCKGMAYLANMKLVHRDLAARNVLLAEGKICKISDFGLTRDVYEGDLYFKRSKGRVPVKWMAIESLVDHVYTSKSDIWGFGVLLWELITLGSSPYPGVTPERLFTLLQSGYRMDKPDNCSDDLYQVMKSCWHENSARRPTFNQLVSIFERMIEADVEYLELRSLIVTNRSYFDESINETAIPDVIVGGLQVKNSASITNDTKSEPITDETKLDQDSYLLARNSFSLDPSENGASTEPLVMINSPTSKQQMPFVCPQINVHNPVYSPSRNGCSTLLQPQSTPLQYSSLANRPDEEDDAGIVVEEGQDGCHSEGDSDSGRTTGDSGYLTEEGRKIREHKNDSSSQQIFENSSGSCRNSGGSLSSITRHELDDEQDTSEEFEERPELLIEELLGTTAVSSLSNQKEFSKEARGTMNNSSSGDLAKISRNKRSPVQV